jgi:hypothetical protein
MQWMGLTSMESIMSKVRLAPSMSSTTPTQTRQVPTGLSRRQYDTIGVPWLYASRVVSVLWVTGTNTRCLATL